MDKYFLTGTVWIHNKTGDVRRVAGVDPSTDAVRLVSPGGSEINRSVGQLHNLYFQTDEPEDLSRFPLAIGHEGESIDNLSIGRLVMDLKPVDPLPDRRRFNNGSVRIEGR